MSYPNKNQELRIGVLLLAPVEFLDVAPIDLLGMLSASYMKTHDLPSLVPLALKNVTIHYISPDYNPHDPSTSVTPCTAEAALRVTRSLTSKDCAPGALDILVIPGPPPSYEITADVKAFIRGHAAVKETTILNICIGVFVAAQAGILDGITATGAGLLRRVRENFKNVNWVFKRWARDRNIWTSGSITNGNDMVAAFLRERYPGELSKRICEIADVGDRGQDFPNPESD